MKAQNHKTTDLVAAVTAAALLLTVACGGEPDPSDPSQPGPGLSQQTFTALKAAHGLPAEMTRAAYLGRSLVANGVYAATTLSGRGAHGVVVKSGTLTQRFPGNLYYFSYSPQPADRLVVAFTNGTRHELTISRLQGNLNVTSPEQFLSSNHSLAYRHVIPGQADLTVDTSNLGGQWTFKASGTFTRDKVKHSTDFVASGSYFFNNDTTGGETKTTYTVRGKVKAPGFSIDVNESHFFHLASSTGSTLYSKSGGKSKVATHSIDTNNNTLTIGGDTFRFDSCRLRKVFRDGKPSDNDPWQATGRVLRNGKGWGAYRYVRGALVANGGKRQFQLVTEQGTHVLESWNE